MYEAGPIYKTHQMQKLPYTPADDGFVLSTAQINQKLSRENHFDDAQIAKHCDYDIEKYQTHKANS